MSLENAIEKLNKNIETLIVLLSKQQQLELSFAPLTAQEADNDHAEIPAVEDTPTIESSNDEQITEDMVRKLSDEKIKAGFKRTELKEIIASGGAKTIAKLSPEGLEKVYNELKKLEG